jgi:hypothetical protein
MVGSGGSDRPAVIVAVTLVGAVRARWPMRRRSRRRRAAGSNGHRCTDRGDDAALDAAIADQVARLGEFDVDTQP